MVVVVVVVVGGCGLKTVSPACAGDASADVPHTSSSRRSTDDVTYVGEADSAASLPAPVLESAPGARGTAVGSELVRLRFVRSRLEASSLVVATKPFTS